MSRIKLATRDGVRVGDAPREANPQTMFYRFAKTPSLNLEGDGINGANEFRKIFSGTNPFYRMIHHLLYLLIGQRHYLIREDLVRLIHQYGGYSRAEAEIFLDSALDQQICYSAKKVLRKMHGQNLWSETEDKKYFTLCCRAWIYYLNF